MPLNWPRPSHLAADSHKYPSGSADNPSDSATRSPSGIAAVGRSLGLPHPHSDDPTRSVAGSAPRECAYRGPRRVCRTKPADASLLGPTIISAGMSVATPLGCSMLIPQGTRVGVPAAVSLVVSVVGSADSPAAGSVLVSVALPAVASAESPAAGSVGLSADVTDGSHVGIPTCRSIGTEVTVVNFAT